VAHAYNPSYSGGSYQDDPGSKDPGSKPPLGQIVHDTLSQKYKTQKRLAEWLKW
jgi:hypothetical protein